MAREAERLSPRVATAPGPNAVLLADRREGPDLWGVTEAMRPLAELCLSGDAETPFALGLIGGRGAGKSFALRRLIEAVDALARAARPPLLSRVVVAEVDADARDPASAAASAVYAALESEFAALADEAAHATLDPRRAAAAAFERHDEIVTRLEQERHARDEVESRRARLSDALLNDIPGSRIDAFIRTNRSAIETRIRRFGFVDGDPTVNFRGLVGDLAGVRSSSRAGLFLRSIWAYRGQTRLIVLAILAFALAFGAAQLRQPALQDWLTGLSGGLAPAIAGVKAHDDWLQYASEALVVAGVVALLINVWRAASFTGLLFQGLRMLNLDVRERRRELDASAARLERRVAALQLEADAAQQRAESMARRAGGGQPSNRPPGPAFVAPDQTQERVARAFLDDLGRAMGAGSVPAPQRLLIAVDGLDALAPAEARAFLATVVRIAGRGAAVIAAVDPARLGDARELAETLFDVVYDIEPPAGALAARWLAPGPAPAPTETKRLELAAPLDETDIGFLKAATPLLGPRPRTLKRFYNAYRLARLGDAPRGAVALSLAALMAPDPSAAASLRATLSGDGAWDAPATPAALRAAFAALGAQGMGKDAARRAFEAARRFAPWG